MSPEEFLSRYFIQPIYSGEGYNVYNTIAYGLLLGAGILGLERVISRLGLRVERRFLLALLPFMVFASASRSLVDAGIFPRSAWLITPGIFISTTAIAFASLFIALSSRRFLPYHYTMLILGAPLALYPLYRALTSVYHWEPLLYMAGLLPLSILAFIFLLRRLGYRELGHDGVKAVFGAHMLDATATVVGVEYYGFFEEHVFEDWLIGIAGTAYIIYPLKLLVLVVVVEAIKNMVEGENRNYWYLVFFILGFAPGLRDTLTIILLK